MFQRTVLFIILITVITSGCASFGGAQNQYDTVENVRVAYGELEDNIVNAMITESDKQLEQALIAAIGIHYREVDDDDLDAVKAIIIDVLTSEEVRLGVQNMLMRDYGFSRGYLEEPLDYLVNKYQKDILGMDTSEALTWLGYIEIGFSIYQKQQEISSAVAGEDGL